MKKFLLVTSLSFLLVGCATVSNTGGAASPGSAVSSVSAVDSVYAEDQLFQAKPDVAVVFVYRNATVGAAIGMNVRLDDQLIGKTWAKKYIRVELQPGSHTLTCKTEATSELAFDVEAGKVYYVWQQVKMGILVARNKLQLVNEAVGQKGVKQCKPAKPVEAELAATAE